MKSSTSKISNLLIFNGLLKNTIGVLSLNLYGVSDYEKVTLIHDLSVLEKIIPCSEDGNIIIINDIDVMKSRKFFYGWIGSLEKLESIGIDIENFEHGSIFIISSNDEIRNLKDEYSKFSYHYEYDDTDNIVSIMGGYNLRCNSENKSIDVSEVQISFPLLNASELI